METTKTLSRLKKFKACSYYLERLLIILLVLAAVVYVITRCEFWPWWDDEAWTLLSNTDVQAFYAVTYGQTICAGVLGVVVLHQVTKLLEESIESDVVFLPSHTHRFRVIALAALILAAFVLVVSAVYAALATGTLSGVELSFGDFGLPSTEGWSSALGVSGTNASGLPATYIASAPKATVNLTLLLFAAFMWALSYIFEYGTSMQEEIDSTL